MKFDLQSFTLGEQFSWYLCHRHGTDFFLIYTKFALSESNQIMQVWLQLVFCAKVLTYAVVGFKILSDIVTSLPHDRSKDEPYSRQIESICFFWQRNLKEYFYILRSCTGCAELNYPLWQSTVNRTLDPSWIPELELDFRNLCNVVVFRFSYKWVS